MDVLPSALAPLLSHPQFIVYVLKPSEGRPGKTEKVPVDPHSLRPIDPHLPSAWLPLDNAIVMAKLLGNQYGVGYVLTVSDPFWFLDIDNCFDTDAKDWTPLAKNLCEYFAGAAIEVSSSGKGLHIIGTGNTTLDHASKDTCEPRLNLEFYTKKRFIALTGTNAIGDASKDFTSHLPGLINSYFTRRVSVTPQEWTNEPCEQWEGPADDEELIRRALRSNSAKAAFGSGVTFKDLWECNEEVLSRVYPSQNANSAYDESSVDIVLASHLAFWTGNNCERILTLMFQSKLVREKWNRDSYIRPTILNACAGTNNWYRETRAKEVALVSTGGISKGFITFEQQQRLFQGCIYVQDAHRVLVPGGKLLKNDQFQATYGGYVFTLDATNQKPTRNAWEAFTQSQVIPMPIVTSTCFRPDLPEATIIEKDGQMLVNTYSPIITARKVGDAGLFLQHIAKLVPDECDRVILLSYLAACVQYKGVKFKWCPFIQGTEGNGKSVITDCVRFAIGDKYTHSPTAAEITEKYNDWMHGTLLIGIDDIFIADSNKDIMERIKPMIDRERLEIRAMHANKVMKDICCNFILNSNHKDGIRKGRNDRRFAPFYTPQQSADDLIRDGLTREYFTCLFNWLERNEGYAIVSEFLHTYQIPDEFNPAHKGIAPTTTSTRDAIANGLGRIEQEIEEAIGCNEIGFRGGWVSSHYLNELLERKQASRLIPLNKRRDLLQSLGYDWHQALKDGRVNNVVMPDNVKSRLFIKNGHPDASLTCAAEVARLYTYAQGTN